MTEKESRVIDWTRGICVLLIVSLHTHVAHKFPSVPHGVDAENWLDVLNFPSILGLYCISYYLFFLNWRKYSGIFPFWKDKCKKRIRSLFIPYIIWTVVSVGFLLVSGQKEVLYWDEHGWSFWSLWAHRGWLESPIGFGLWYIRSLMVLAVLSPAYLLVYKYLGRACYLIGIFLWFLPATTSHNPWFFAAGFIAGKMAYDGISVGQISKYFSGWHYFGLVVLLRIIMHGRHLPFSLAMLLEIGFVLAIIANLLSHEFPDWAMKCLSFLANVSTFVYFVHFTIANFTRHTLMYVPATNTASVFCLYIVSWLSTFFISAILAVLLRRHMRWFYLLLTGGRG